MKSDIRVIKAEPFFPQAVARVPLKFGAVVVESLPFCHVRAEVENRSGARACGWGAMFLMDLWAWPVSPVSHEKRSQAMIETTRRLCRLYEDYSDFGHPVELFHRLEPEFQKIAKGVCDDMGLPEVMPFLCTLVCASPLDAAVHDAFGLVNNVNVYDACGPEFCGSDLSAILGRDFKGKYISDYLVPMSEKIPAFHLVGGLDKLTEAERTASDPDDGLPVGLDKWIRRERLRWLKVKLKGSDLKWDMQRIRDVIAVIRETQKAIGIDDFEFTADTNEQCQSPDYIVELLERLREEDKEAYERLLYVEQPTERDLEAHRWDMRPIAKLKPVIIDESLARLEDFALAMELGWSGIALKACKCQSGALLFASLASERGAPFTVQDLTNPGLGLVQSVSLAGHLRTLRGVETNSRQFFPADNAYIAKAHPGLVRLTEGMLNTSSIGGFGIGYRGETIEMPWGR
ncbi:MAG TPA: enolase C-terminal domain-like protein [Candidatus Brocadiia bacterium]|nr:enolase C-terminal domain-like protein [Candidatus Brocadiia bacterium]